MHTAIHKAQCYQLNNDYGYRIDNIAIQKRLHRVRIPRLGRAHGIRGWDYVARDNDVRGTAERPLAGIPHSHSKTAFALLVVLRRVPTNCDIIEPRSTVAVMVLVKCYYTSSLTFRVDDVRRSYLTTKQVT